MAPKPAARKSIFSKPVTAQKGKAPAVPAHAKITVRINGLELFETKSGSALIEFDMLGSEKKATRTPSQDLRRGKADFQEFEKQYDASEGSALYKAISKAFQSDGDEDEGELEFVVYKVDDKGGKEVEVGVALLKVEEMLENKKDHSGTLSVLDNDDKEVGKLTCEVSALAALQQIDDEVEAAAAAAPPKIAIEVAQLKVNAAGLKAHKLRSGAAYSVEVDLLGVDALVERTKKVTASSQDACSFKYAKSHDAAPGSALGSAVQQALRS